MSRHCGCDFRIVQISAPRPWCVSSAIELLASACPALARRHSARAVLPVLSPSKKGRRNKAEEVKVNSNLDACVCRAETPSEIPIAVNVPASTLIEYKYIRKNNGAVTWELDPNNRFSSPANGSFALNDTWR
ncbi:hypothetical protein B0H14DRAFT_51384 [Mycena olivaceomarginata]|nr:hypothetical protein B0H14DRAFT_51384 [Mycena olivaceomarginata]